MDITVENQFTTIFPSFVLHKRFKMPEGFNDRLAELAIDDALRNRVTDESKDEAIGKVNNHIGHLRHNFLVDCTEPEVTVLTQLADMAVREYLKLAYDYEHQGELQMMADTFYQRRSHGENIGVSAHTHLKADLVVTYYPRVSLDEGETNVLRTGGVRFFDPTNVGRRYWPCNRSDYFTGGWLQTQPETGSLLVFEGYLPHDSTYFAGEDRVCIPIMVDVDTPKKHTKAAVSDIISLHANNQ